MIDMNLISVKYPSTGYRITVNYQITGSNNCYITFNTVVMTEYSGGANNPTYSVTPESNNTNYGTVEISDNVITASPKSGYRVSTSNPYTVSPENSATVEQDGNEFTVTPSANTTVTINFEAIPTHDITFNTNGVVTISKVTIAEGDTYSTLPTAEAFTGYLTENCEFGTFVGWTTESSISDASVMPSLVSSVTMESSDVPLYAVYSKTEGGTTNSGSVTIIPSTTNFPTSYGTANTFTEYTLEGYTFKIQQGYKNGLHSKKESVERPHDPYICIILHRIIPFSFAELILIPFFL